ncbi:hypothetical protein BDD12DRAFT_877829 [Trichophaea hybrida]|nr:hypothetical protein BDD12DRAFT_877829 [Trichophaea hybrida]
MASSVRRDQIKVNGEDSESTQKDQSDDDAWHDVIKEAGGDGSRNHQNATQQRQDSQEEISHGQKHSLTPQSQENIDMEKPLEENQLQQTNRVSQRTDVRNNLFHQITFESQTRVFRTEFFHYDSHDSVVPNNFVRQIDFGWQPEISTKREEQVVYVNGVRTVVRNNNGILYTKQGLSLIEYFLTKMENEYVKRPDHDNLEREHEKLKSEHETLKYHYQKDQQSLSNLQESALSRVDRYQPLPDSEIEKELREIGRSVTDLSSDLVSKAALEVLRESLSGQALSEDMHLNVWDNMRKWNSRLVVQSVIWKELYERLFQNPFSLFEHSHVHMASWNGLFGEGPQVINDYPPPSEMSEQWRVITFNALNELSQRATQPTADIALGVLHSLADKLVPIGFQSDQHLSELLAIVSSAQQLAKRERFSKKKVHDHKLDPANRYGEDIDSGKVLFVVAPGLRKWGDGNGRRLDIFDDIIPAKVLIDGPVE